MSQSILDLERSFIAENDLSDSRYTLLTVGTNENEVAQATAVTDKLLGVLQNKPKAGEAALVRFGGTTKLVAGGTISKGDYITTDGSGQAATPAGASGENHVIGVALESASGSGEIIEVQIQNFKGTF